MGVEDAGMGGRSSVSETIEEMLRGAVEEGAAQPENTKGLDEQDLIAFIEATDAELNTVRSWIQALRNIEQGRAPWG